ncbi:MAG: CapA family protein [Clostridiaceae bacterium]
MEERNQKPNKYKNLSFQERIMLFQKKNRRQTDSQAVLLLLGLIVLYLVVQLANAFTASAQVVVTKDAKFTATMVGDMMFGRNVQKVVDSKGYDFLFRYAKPYLDASDYNTGNFENPIILRDESEYELPDKSIYLHARADVAPYLSSIGFTTVNLANNHLMDYGVAGLTETLDTFAKTETAAIGGGLNKFQSGQIHYEDYNGFVVATVGMTDVGYQWGYSTDHQAGANKTRLTDVLPIVKEARKNADLVIVHSHWGVEYDSSPNPRQKEIGRALVNAGADIVVGHHSHTLQPVEIYKGKVIFYSLGNFVFDQGWTKTKDSVVAQFKIHDDGSKTVELTPMKVNEASPTPLSGPLAGMEFNRMKTLLTKDLDSKIEWEVKDDKIIINLGTK